MRPLDRSSMATTRLPSASKWLAQVRTDEARPPGHERRRHVSVSPAGVAATARSRVVHRA